MGFYFVLNLTKLHEVYIFLKTKGSFTNIQNSKPGIQRVVAYGVSEVADFSLFFRGGRGPPQRNLNFWIFGKKQSAMELFISIFENSSPKGSFR